MRGEADERRNERPAQASKRSSQWVSDDAGSGHAAVKQAKRYICGWVSCVCAVCAGLLRIHTQGAQHPQANDTHGCLGVVRGLLFPPYPLGRAPLLSICPLVLHPFVHHTPAAFVREHVRRPCTLSPACGCLPLLFQKAKWPVPASPKIISRLRSEIGTLKLQARHVKNAFDCKCQNFAK